MSSHHTHCPFTRRSGCPASKPARLSLGSGMALPMAFAIASFASLLVALAGAGCTSQPTTAPTALETVVDHTPTQRTIDSALAVKTFDEAWRIVRDTHFDKSMGGLDWDAVRDEFQPRAASALSNDELRGVLNEMLMRLGLSHFAILPADLSAPATERTDAESPTATTTTSDSMGDRHGASDDGASPKGSLGIQVRVVEGRVTVTTVAPESDAAAAGVAPGWIVERIDGRRAAGIVDSVMDGAEARGGWNDYVANAVLMDRLDRPVGRVVTLELLDADDRPVEIELVSRTAPGDTVELGPLRLTGTFDTRTVADEEVRTAVGPSGAAAPPVKIGLIGFSVWIVQVTEPFHRAVDAHRSDDGIVIDLRGNPGGIGGLVMGIGGHFLDEPQSLGEFRTRDASLQFRANPRRTSADGELVAPFAGPVAVLVDGMSGSTSEIFAGGMQAIGRVRIFGATSAGAALPAALSQLPNGDTLMHAIADFILPDGVRLEGRGVVPDEAVSVTRADLLSGRDPILEAAIRWIVGQRPAVPIGVDAGGKSSGVMANNDRFSTAVRNGRR